MSLSSDSPINRAEALEVLNNLEAIKRRLLAQHPDLDGELGRQEGFHFRGGASLPGAVPTSADDLPNFSGLNPRSPQIGPAAHSSHALQKKLLPLPNFPRTPNNLSAAEAEDIKALIREELQADRVMHSQTKQIGHLMSPIAEHPTCQGGGLDESVESGSTNRINSDGSTNLEPANKTGWAGSPESGKKDGLVNDMESGRVETRSPPLTEHRRGSLDAVDAHTGRIYPSTSISRAGSKPIEHNYEGNAENAYGAFIHISLEQGLAAAMYKCGPMLAASVCIQFAFSYELFRALPPLTESPWFCEIPWDLQVSAVGVFITLMLNNVWGMINASWISLRSDERKVQVSEHEEVKEHISVGRSQRLVIFLLAVLTEVGTWSGILSSGVLFILTSQSVDLVIRSTVAIMFVQNVDEIIFESCCSREIKESLRNASYKTLHPFSVLGYSKDESLLLENRYSLFVHLPVIAAISCGVVFGMRLLPELSCLHF